MKLKMIALISSVLGSAAALSVHYVGPYVLAHHGANHGTENQTIQELMYADPSTPIDAKVDPLHSYPASDRGPMNNDRPILAGPNQPTKNSAVLVLVRTTELTSAKDPIWQLRLVKGEKTLSVLPAVTGRASKQTANRHVGGNKSPLPQGTYTIDRPGIVRESFSDPELGRGYWIPITPAFPTGRSALGFHHDPSWGRNNGESGTSGCVGLRTPEDTLTLVEWIKHFNVHKLIVVS